MSRKRAEGQDVGFTVGELEVLETLDPRLEKYLDGTLSPQESDLLNAQALEDEELALALAAYAPLGAEFEEGVTDSLLGSLHVEEVPAGPGLLERVRSWFSLKTPVLVPALALCSVLALWMPQDGHQEGLPAYGVTVSSYDKALRGADTGADSVPEFSVGSRLGVILRPATALDFKVQARLYLKGAEGVVRLGLSPLISEQGAIRVEGIVGEDFPGAPGEYELWVVVSGESRWPAASALEEKLIIEDGVPGWRVYRQSYLVGDGGAVNVP